MKCPTIFIIIDVGNNMETVFKNYLLDNIFRLYPDDNNY